MRKNILTVFIVVAALFPLLISGCATKTSNAPHPTLAALEARIIEAEGMDAVTCAPEELAQARAILAHARHETGEDAEDAETYINAAQKAVDKLLAKTIPCYQARQKKPAPELDASLTPTSVTAGECSVLAWSSANAVLVALEPGGDNLALNGTRDVCPPTSTIYRLTATGPGGTVSRSVTLEVIETLNDVEPPQPAMSRLSPIYFDFDRDLIREDAKPGLADVAAVLMADNTITLMLEGHCDERGTTEYNVGLGQRRAVAARSYLNNLGVALSRLDTISYGEERPAAPGHDEAAWALNRRVEFMVK